MMRISKVTGLAVAGVAMAGALAIGGVAYASGGGDGTDGDVVVRIQTVEDDRSGATSGATERDCPEKNGGAGAQEPGQPAPGVNL
jgi:hypothetical protein